MSKGIRTVAWMSFLLTSSVYQIPTSNVWNLSSVGTVHSGFLCFNPWILFSRPSAYLYSCLPDINAILMPLKYESMPKITFCFMKDYLEEIRKIVFALQVLPVFWDTGLHFMLMCFSLISVLKTQWSKLKEKKKIPEDWLETSPLKNYIYKLGFVIRKYFLPLLLFCLNNKVHLYK